MLRISGVPISVHVRKVTVTAIEKDIPYEIDPVIPLKPPAGFRDLSPLGKIPAIRDGDFTLADSSAICAYLERKQPEPALYPSEPRAYGRALWLEEYFDTALVQDVLAAFFQKIIRPKVLGEEGDKAIIEQVVSTLLPPKLDYIEAQISGQYLVGDRLSIADVALASSLINWHYAGLPKSVFDRRPRLVGYFEKLLGQRSIAKALVAEDGAARSMGLDRSFIGA